MTKIYDQQVYDEYQQKAWDTIRRGRLAAPLTAEKDQPWLLFAELIGRVDSAERETKTLTYELMGERDDHILIDGALYSRAYIEGNMHEFNWQLRDVEGTYPCAILQKWPDMLRTVMRVVAEEDALIARNAVLATESQERLEIQRKRMMLPPEELTEREQRMQKLWKAWGFPTGATHEN